MKIGVVLVKQQPHKVRAFKFVPWRRINADKHGVLLLLLLLLLFHLQIECENTLSFNRNSHLFSNGKSENKKTKQNLHCQMPLRSVAHLASFEMKLKIHFLHF